MSDEQFDEVVRRIAALTVLVTETGNATQRQRLKTMLTQMVTEGHLDEQPRTTN